MGKKDKTQGNVTMTPTLLKKVIETATQTAIEVFQKEAEKARGENRDKRLHNTELLLKKYRGLKEYSDDAVFDATQVDDDMRLLEILDLMSEGEGTYSVSVRSMRERVAQTRIILHHVDKMLAFYEHECRTAEKLEEARKWETVDYLYLRDEDKKTIQELSEFFDVDMSTAYRYRRTAISDLSVLFFGIIE